MLYRWNTFYAKFLFDTFVWHPRPKNHAIVAALRGRLSAVKQKQRPTKAAEAAAEKEEDTEFKTSLPTTYCPNVKFRIDKNLSYP